MRIFDFINFFQGFSPRVHPSTIDPYFSRGFRIMGGAKRTTNLIADLLKFVSKFCLLIYMGRIVSSISTLIAGRALDYCVVLIQTSP